MRIPNLLRDFIADKRGNTAANVVWILLVLGLSGITIDTVRAFQMKSMMQATADVSALGASLELPETPQNAPAMATAMVGLNMPSDLYGNLLTEEEVLVGRWDPNINQLNVGATPPNATWVTVRRATDRGNSFGTSLLTLVGLTSWDINVESIAFIQWRECWSSDGIIANGKVQFESESRFGDNFCVYGHEGIDINNGNDFTGLPLGGNGTGALVGTGNVAYRTYGCEGVNHIGGGSDPCDYEESNPGIRDAMFHTDELEAWRLNDFNADVIAAYEEIFRTNGLGVPAEEFYMPKDWQIKGGTDIEADLFAELTDPNNEYKTYYLKCGQGESALQINNGNFNNFTIVTNCPVKIVGSASTDPEDHGLWENITIITVSENNMPDSVIVDNDAAARQNVNFYVSGGNKFGSDCGAENSVSFFTSQSFQIAANTRYRGVEVTAADDLIMAGNQISYQGDIGSFSAHVGDNVTFTSTSDFVHCPIGDDIVVVQARASLVH